MGGNSLVLRLRLLGLVQIERDGQAFSQFRSRKSLALLGYLAGQGQAVSRSGLATLLWPDKPEAAGRRDLRWTLNYLSKLLPDTFEATHQTITFRPDETTWVDTTAFEGLAGQGDAGSLAEAAALYRGEFLAGLYLDDCPEFELWLLQAREHWRQRVIKVLSTLVERYLDQGDYARGQDFARRWLEIEPWRESAHRQLMRLLALSGQRSAALSQYETCCRILADELDVEPMPETIALYEQIRAGKLSREVGEQRSSHPGTGGQGENRKSKIQNRKSQDWGEAPDSGVFYGRQAELARLERWLITDRCRLVAVLGIGGVGKTALVAKLARSLVSPPSVSSKGGEFEGGFDFVFWRSLLNTPPPAEVLRAVLQFLSNQTLTDLPDSLDEQLVLLFDYLRQYRCLLVLDNLESILQSGRAGYYEPGYEVYGQLIQRVGESEHQSCLLLTSRERPHGIARLEGDTPLVRSLQLAGLTGEAGQEILNARGLSGPVDLIAALVARYSGHPLALKLVSHTIQELFDNDIAAFLSAETPIFDDIRVVLGQQFARLSPLEQEVLVWLAIDREAVSPQALSDNLIRPAPKRALLEALRSLQRRSLLEKVSDGFTLQNVVCEFTTDYLVEGICREIEVQVQGSSGPPEGSESRKVPPSLAAWVEGQGGSLLNSHALLKAQAKEYMRQTQVRLILQPIAERLAASLGPVRLEATFRQVLSRLQREASLAPGYAAGNIFNLLLRLDIEVRGFDFSQLSVWQAYLRGARLPEVNFAGADLTGSVFNDTFGFVFSVAFGSATGEQGLIAAGTENGQIRLWRAADGQPVGVYTGHTETVSSLAFSSDGRILVSGSADQTIRLWGVRSGRSISTLRGHTDKVNCVAFSPDGQILASGSDDWTIRLWDISTLPVLSEVEGLNTGAAHAGISGVEPASRTLRGHTDKVICVAFSPDGQTLACGSYDQTVRLVDLKSGQVRHILSGHAHAVLSVAFSLDGQTLASSSADRTIHLWDVVTGRFRCTLTEHTDVVWCLAFSPDGQILASGSSDRTIRLWDVNNNQVNLTLAGHTDHIRSLSFSPDGQSLVSSSGDQTVRLWDVRTGQAVNIWQGHTRAVHAVSFSPTGDTLASGGFDHMVRLWGVANAGALDVDQPLDTWPGHTNNIYAVAFSPDGHTLASGSADRTIRLWDVERRQTYHILQGHTDEVNCLAFNSTGDILASGGSEQIIRLWDIKGRNKRLIHTLQGHTGWVQAVAFSPDGQTLASSGSMDQTVRLWDVKHLDGPLLHTWQTDIIFSLAFSPDGQTLAGGGHDGIIRLWDAHSKQSRHTLEGHPERVFSVAFSPDGQILASGSADQTICFWDVCTGACLHVLEGHTHWVWSVAFSPDGQTLASGSADETVRLWDVRSGQCLKTLYSEGPYAGMNITGTTGLTEAQKQALKVLGAVEGE